MIYPGKQYTLFEHQNGIVQDSNDVVGSNNHCNILSEFDAGNDV